MAYRQLRGSAANLGVIQRSLAAFVSGWTASGMPVSGRSSCLTASLPSYDPALHHLQTTRNDTTPPGVCSFYPKVLPSPLAAAIERPAWCRSSRRGGCDLVRFFKAKGTTNMGRRKFAGTKVIEPFKLSVILPPDL